MDHDLLERTLAELDEPRYRARQIWRWAAQGAAGFDAMTDLPLRLRSALNEAVRRGLHPAGKAGGKPYRVKPFRSGYRPGVDRLRLNQLADELDTDGFLRARTRKR